MKSCIDSCIHYGSSVLKSGLAHVFRVNVIIYYESLNSVKSRKKACMSLAKATTYQWPVRLEDSDSERLDKGLKSAFTSQINLAVVEK